MVYEHDLACPKKLLRDDQAANSIDGTPSCISNDMRIAFF